MVILETLIFDLPAAIICKDLQVTDSKAGLLHRACCCINIKHCSQVNMYDVAQVGLFAPSSVDGHGFDSIGNKGLFKALLFDDRFGVGQWKSSKKKRSCSATFRPTNKDFEFLQIWHPVPDQQAPLHLFCFSFLFASLRQRR